MRKYKVTFLEEGSPSYRTTFLTGNKTEQEVIDWFGLENDDILEYKIEVEDD